jgi:hypothetical protein
VDSVFRQNDALIQDGASDWIPKVDPLLGPML